MDRFVSIGVNIVLEELKNSRKSAAFKRAMVKVLKAIMMSMGDEPDVVFVLQSHGWRFEL